jgi:hypothetical protein
MIGAMREIYLENLDQLTHCTQKRISMSEKVSAKFREVRKAIALS